VNNNLVPKAALEAYSLLYDIKQKKPALDLREGTFYNGIPDISIKVNQKFPDGISLKDVIIYDHRNHDGNKDVTVADSGKMYTILNERYLKLELFDGYNYTEGTGTQQDLVGTRSKANAETISRSKFDKMQVVFDLSSFQLARTDKKWFQGNRIMRNLSELEADLDSLRKEILNYKLAQYNNYSTYFYYFTRHDSIPLPPELRQHKKKRDSLARAQMDKQDKEYMTSPDIDVPQPTPESSVAVTEQPVQRIEKPRGRLAPQKRLTPTRVEADPVVATVIKEKAPVLTDSAITAKLDSVLGRLLAKESYSSAVNKARVVKTQLNSTQSTLEVYSLDQRVFLIQWHKILASSFACIAMFLIGAPLGAIIKKGGLGVPFLVSILFFIIYYLLTMIGEKWAKQGVIDVMVGVWAADFILLLVGIIFLRQARRDARLFEADFYRVVFDKVQRWLRVRRSTALDHSQ
jgi:lipopolysaccharide export system permease protein